jgi:PKD repeat protein
MKKINLSLFFSLCYFLTQAQITFLRSDLPTAGFTNAQQKDTATGRVVNFGNKGANQVYDFSSFHFDQRDSIFYLAPTSAQHAKVPNATLAVTTDHNTFILGQDSTTFFDFDGLQTVAFGNTIISNYTQIDTVYKYPVSYGRNFKGTYGGDTRLKATSVNSNLGLLGWDSIKIVNSTVYFDTIDGWGTVKTPVGTYKCLRDYRVERGTTTLYYNTTTNSNYQLMPTSILGTQVLATNPILDTTYNYTYLTKEAHGSIINFTYDSIHQPNTASWSTLPPFPVANFGYTLGASGSVALHDSSTGAPLTYSWNFGDGTAVSTAGSPSHNFSANGTYYVCLTVTNASGSNTKCDSVHITNIAAGTPPVAQITPAGQDTICPGASVVLRAQTGTGYTFKWSNNSTADSIIVTTAGSYTVKVFNAAHDSATSAPTVVVINPANAALTLTGPATFCTGDSTRISAAAGQTYHWSTGATTQAIEASASGSYLVTVTNGNHCTAVSSPQVITVNTPQADNITRAGLVLTSQTENSYQWYEGSTLLTGATLVTYTATQNGVYNVHYTDANGCAGVSNSITITGVGINEISAADYRVYPNPANDMIQVDFSHMDQSTLSSLSDIVIYNVLGEKVKTVSINQTSISVRDLSNGVYMIAVMDKNQNRKVLGKFEVLK